MFVSAINGIILWKSLCEGAKLMKVCALILNYNTFDYVKSLVDILYFNDKIDYICVVDNCSSDTSWDDIKKLNNKKTYI